MDEFSTVEICKELKHRIIYTNGLYFVPTDLLKYIVKEIEVEISTRRIENA